MDNKHMSLVGPSEVCSLPLGDAGRTYRSERSAWAALGHCRQNVVATIIGIFFLLPGL